MFLEVNYVSPIAIEGYQSTTTHSGFCQSTCAELQEVVIFNSL